MPPKTTTPVLRVVVLIWCRLVAEMVRYQIQGVWPNAEIQVFQLGFAALDCIQASTPDLFITGVDVEDMDGLEHLEPFIETSLPIMILVARPDLRTFDLLREIRYDGIYDGLAEGLENLPAALQQVLQHRLYVSPSLTPHLKAPKNITLDALTETEQIVLSVIGDGSDDTQASERLGQSSQTIGSHRKAIMRKLRLHHKGELMLYALQHGYVRVTPDGVFYPGFQRRIQGAGKERSKARSGHAEGGEGGARLAAPEDKKRRPSETAAG